MLPRKEKVSLTTMTVTYPLDDDDLPFESAYDNLYVTWHVVDPEYDRIREPDPWVSHDWTMDYDNDEDFE